MANIPDNAKKVFEGVIFDVYHWEQELYDGSTTTFEMLSRQPSTEVIIVVDQKILMLNQEQPGREAYPSLPGGRVEPGENPKLAALREIREETGYTCQETDLEQLYLSTGNSKLYFPEYFFLTRTATKTHEPLQEAGEYISPPRFVTFDEFLQTVRDPLFATSWGLKQILLEALLDKSAYTALKKNILG